MQMQNALRHYCYYILIKKIAISVYKYQYLRINVLKEPYLRHIYYA